MPPRASYAIDADDRIVWTDSGFAVLAEAHGQPGLATGALGRPLIEFVAGERPRALQQALIARARRAADDEPLELRYRCDAPEMRRYAVLQMTPQPEGRILFTTWFEATEPRPYQPLLDPATPRGDGASARLCAWCNRVDPGDGWREVEDAAPAAAGAHPPAVEHGLCEICELLLTGRPAGGPRWSGPSGLP